MGITMRAALASVLMMAAAVGWAAGPIGSDASSAATEQTFKPPDGYKPKRINGELLYCTRVRIENSRFTTEECRTEAQLAELERSKRQSRENLDQLRRSCSGVGCSN
jgi:hypothetical protein